MRLVLIAFLVYMIQGCSSSLDRPADPSVEHDAVVKAIETSIRWCFPDKSRERLYGSVVQDSTYFMFQPDSRSTIRGFDEFLEFSERVFMVDACRPLGSEIRDLRVVFSRSGTVAWFSCLVDDWGEWDGTPWLWKDTRWTGVLEKIDGRWVMMQQHFSNAEDAVRAEVLKEVGAGN